MFSFSYLHIFQFVSLQIDINLETLILEHGQIRIKIYWPDGIMTIKFKEFFTELSLNNLFCMRKN